VPHCVGVANATDGLTLSLLALGVRPGDEVITTPFTAIPTVAAIVDAGAIPVFADVDPKTYLLDVDAAVRALTPRTKAIIPVHIFGNVFDVRELRKRLPAQIPIVEDAAQAHGASLGSIKAGAMGETGVFSFYPTKNLGGYGDGGAIVTNSEETAAKLCKLRMFGMVDKDHIDSPGINSRLDELQAAILRVKLRYLETMNQQRRVIADRYKQGLPRELFTFQRVPEHVVCNYHVFVAEVQRHRDELIKYLEEKNIQTNIYYPLPLSKQKALDHLGYGDGDFPVAEALCRKIVALPMYPEFPISEQTRVIESINEFFGGGDGDSPEQLKAECTIAEPAKFS
jgi:dTDP-4-amino-4,6-dideoxygalactose transaminase